MIVLNSIKHSINDRYFCSLKTTLDIDLSDKRRAELSDYIYTVYDTETDKRGTVSLDTMISLIRENKFYKQHRGSGYNIVSCMSMKAYSLARGSKYLDSIKICNRTMADYSDKVKRKVEKIVSSEECSIEVPRFYKDCDDVVNALSSMGNKFGGVDKSGMVLTCIDSNLNYARANANIYDAILYYPQYIVYLRKNVLGLVRMFCSDSELRSPDRYYLQRFYCRSKVLLELM